LTDVSQILTQPGIGMGLSYAKHNLYDIFSRLSTMHERDKQTGKTDNGTVTIDRNRRNRLSSAMSPKNK